MRRRAFSRDVDKAQNIAEWLFACCVDRGWRERPCNREGDWRSGADTACNPHRHCRDRGGEPEFLVGFGGLVSLGHAAFFGLGGYTVAILYSNAISGERFWGFLPGTQQLLVTAPLAMLIGGSAAAVIGAMAMRTRGVQFIMITLAFAQMIFFIVLSLKAYGGEDGLSIRQRNNLGSFSLSDDTIMYFVSLSIMIACFAAMGRLKNSHFGRVLDGIRQNERRMIALGVETFSYKVAAFTIAGMGAGLSGALFANLMRFVSPDMLHWTKSGELLIMVILGGVGNLFGPLAGAIVFIGLETLFFSLTEYGSR